MDLELRRDLIGEYIQASTEFLDELDQRLIRMEKGEAGEEDLAEILRLLHTFKGNSGLMGFEQVQTFTHRFEDLFKQVQSEHIPLHGDAIECAMGCAASLRECLSGLSVDNLEPADIGPGFESIERLLQSSGENNGHYDQALSSQISGDAVLKKTNLIKVDFARLDQLLNLMGEIVVHRSRLGRIEGLFKKEFGMKATVREFIDASEKLGRLTTDMHEAIMKVRMLPVSAVFARFSRLVRDLSVELGKEVDLIFEGEDTELDKTLVDELGEPLLHLIRNAVDHGIETPEERTRAGKSRRGTILLRASQEASSIVITVEDDGRGIDEGKVRAKAQRLGIADAASASRDEVLDYIFLPGFSTSENVTELSGRGVGMDAVRKGLARISGTIEVDSDPGIGTMFLMKLPLTLAILPALLVGSGAETYAVPLSSVAETLCLDPRVIRKVNGREAIEFRDRVLPLLRLSELFEVPKNGAPPAKRSYVVVIQSSYGRLGLVVGSLKGRHEIVIKPLDECVGDSAGLGGAAVLGDGRVVLVADVREIARRLKREASPSTDEREEI